MVAVKIIEGFRVDSRHQYIFQHELLALEMAHHPNIIRLFEVFKKNVSNLNAFSM